MLLRELPFEERPMERLRRCGAGALSTGELLTIVLGSPDQLGARLLAHFGGLVPLARASLTELEGVEGVGPSRAARVKAALELGRRLLIASCGERPQVRSPFDVAQLLLPEMSLLRQEQLRVVLLDRRHRLLGIPVVYVGSANTALVRVGELFREAVRENASAVILVHNHPGGDPTPSSDDVALTEQAVRAGKLLSIEVLDHIIIGAGRYVSMKDRGLGGF
nr:JAB domain-containing protein [Anaerolineae bacterium]